MSVLEKMLQEISRVTNFSPDQVCKMSVTFSGFTSLVIIYLSNSWDLNLCLGQSGCFIYTSLQFLSSEFTVIIFFSFQVNFVFCMLLCFPLGAVFRLVLHPSRVSVITRRAVGLLWGLLLTWFCFER